MSHKQNIAILYNDINALIKSDSRAVIDEFDYGDYDSGIIGMAVRFGSFGNTKVYGQYNPAYDFCVKHFGYNFTDTVITCNEGLENTYGYYGLSAARAAIAEFMQDENIPFITPDDAAKPVKLSKLETMRNSIQKTASAWNEANADMNQVLDAIIALSDAKEKAHAAIGVFLEKASNSSNPEMYESMKKAIPQLLSEAKKHQKK